MTSTGTIRRTAAAMLVALLAACTPPDPGAVTVTVIGEAPDPAALAAAPDNAAQAVLIGATAQGLVRFDPAGQIEPGLAERWNVSNDGLSYIFRLSTGVWPGDRKVTAADVARLLRRQFAAAARNPLRDTVGAVAEVVAMTDRVLEIRLIAPRPNLLQLLAQPDFALVRNGVGSGPLQIDAPLLIKPADPALLLSRGLVVPDGDPPASEHVRLAAMPAEAAVKAFVAGTSEVVLGGTFADLGVVLGAGVRRSSLRFDPVLGLFGLMPDRADGPLADPAVRALLSAAIDRSALVASLGVPDLQPRASLLQPGLDGIGSPVVPVWATTPLDQRRAALLATARTLFKDKPPTLRIALPNGPGAAILLARLRADWGPLGVTLNPAVARQPADLRLVDEVAPSSSPAWFLRQFRCAFARVCVAEADVALDDARSTLIATQRDAQFGEAERILSAANVFMPLAEPVRWSLTARTITNFVENRFARHPLTNLRDRPQRRD